MDLPNLNTFKVLFESRQFGAGLTAGLVVALLVLVVLGVRSRYRAIRPGAGDGNSRVPGGVGLAFVIATTAVMGGLGPFTQEVHVPGVVVVGLAALWCAGCLSAHVGRGPLVGALLALPGGVLLADGASGFPAWTVALLVLGPALAGTTTSDLDERAAASGTGPVLFAVALGGMYATVPDTELVLVALGVALPVTLLAWPFTLARLGRGGSYAACGLFLWIAVIEGVGRSGSTVGAAACLGLLVAEPVGRALARRCVPGHLRVASLPDTAPPAVLIGAQVVLALYFGRIAGFEVLAARAAVLAAPAAVLAVLGSPHSSPAPDRSDSEVERTRAAAYTKAGLSSGRKPSGMRDARNSASWATSSRTAGRSATGAPLTGRQPSGYRATWSATARRGIAVTKPRRGSGSDSPRAGRRPRTPCRPRAWPGTTRIPSEAWTGDRARRWRSVVP